MKTLRIAFYAIVLMHIFAACQNSGQTYVIGVSQCSEDSWRLELAKELEMSTYLSDNLSVHLAFANDDNSLQEKQIDSLVNLPVDLLIISPNQARELSDKVNEVMQKGIPVILFDRKSETSQYSAFLGADNYLIGAMLAEYLVKQLNGKGNIVEIAGLNGSSPSTERHRGFNDVIKRFPDMHIVGFGNGNWKEESGTSVMNTILSQYDGRIDCVFGGNDRMAIGARKAMQKRGINVHDIIFLGVDALALPGCGMEQVRDGLLTASAIYPTRGDELMELAVNILSGRNYNKVNSMPSSLVTKDNASVLLQQYEIINHRSEYLKQMNSRINVTLSRYATQQYLLIISVVIGCVIAILLFMTIRASRQKRRLYDVVHEKNAELSIAKEVAEQQRDELELERDRLMEEKLKNKQRNDVVDVSTTNESDVPNMKDEAVMQMFYECVDKRIADTELSVDVIAKDLCMSRMNLYRKIRAQANKSPAVLIKEYRLNRAKSLLSTTTLSIAEVAYSVGFASPSYFAKCYRSTLGVLPTDEKAK